MSIRAVSMALAVAVTAFAQSSADAGPVVSDAEMATTREAHGIAVAEGVRRFDSMRFNQATGHWEVRGRDATDGSIELDIEANTGAVVRIIRRPQPEDDDEE